MSEFEFERKSVDRADVRTPFPVGRIPWGYFMLKVFPELESVNEYGVSVPERGRYLNRREGEPVDEIADGQYGDYWKHAYLPHCDRWGQNIAEWGQVQVPRDRGVYLDQLEAELAERPGKHNALLMRLNQTHQRHIGILFDRFFQIMVGLPETTQELRESLLNNLKPNDSRDPERAGMLPYHLSGYGEGLNKEYGVGEYPVISPADTYRSPTVAQTALDFLREVDDVLLGEGYKYREQLAIGTLRTVYTNMFRRYQHFMDEETRKQRRPYEMNSVLDGRCVRRLSVSAA